MSRIAVFPACRSAESVLVLYLICSTPFCALLVHFALFCFAAVPAFPCRPLCLLPSPSSSRQFVVRPNRHSAALSHLDKTKRKKKRQPARQSNQPGTACRRPCERSDRNRNKTAADGTAYEKEQKYRNTNAKAKAHKEHDDDDEAPNPKPIPAHAYATHMHHLAHIQTHILHKHIHMHTCTTGCRRNEHHTGFLFPS